MKYFMHSRQFLQGHLEESGLNPDPMQQFVKWFLDAKNLEPMMPDAMTLATVDADGMPDARIVLVKDPGERGINFFTNYNSHKAHQLESCPKAAGVFWWPELERQVRLRGQVSKLSAEDSAAYFAQRPRGSQLGAWCSPQSQTLENREDLELQYQRLEIEYEGKQIPRPDFWGGYLLKPFHFEFWQGRNNRLHDRFSYDLKGRQWTISRLAP
ncbi:MAG: pyridoxamine 5'-phosphate oxidase [Myxococcota bacterium]